jgi:hypothetical protein
MVPRLLVAFGTNRDRFKSAQEMQQFYGIAPVKKQSGNTKVIHMRHRCPKFARQTFHENASHVVRKEGWAKTCYEQQRARKKGHHAAVRSVAFKLADLFQLLEHKQSYDPNLYENALQKHGSPWPNYSKTRQQLPVNNFQENVDGTTQSSSVCPQKATKITKKRRN